MARYVTYQDISLAECEGFILAHRQPRVKCVRMSDEDRYRTESARDDKSEKVGLLRPLPTSPGSTPGRRPSPVVRFLGVSMRESRRDLLVLLLIPFLIAIVDASVYAAVVVGVLPTNALYMFGIPALAAIIIGLTASQMSHGLIGAIVTALFFAILFLIFLVSPALLSPGGDVGGFFLAGMSLITVYFLLVILSSFVGSFIGIIIREFA